MAVEYVKLKITGNALVPKGAVGVKAVFKGKEQRVVKADDSKLEMHTIMYMVNQFDSHKAIVKQDKVIEEACLDFMLNGEKRVKMTHDGEFVNAHVMQLYIVPENHPMWSEEKYVGALATVTKFGDKELYYKCKEEGWETSLEGDVIEEEISEENIIAKVWEKVKNLIVKEQPMKKDYNDEKAITDMYNKYWNFGSAFHAIIGSDKPVSEKLTELKKSLEQFNADLGNATVVEPTVTDEPVTEETVETAKAEVPAEVMEAIATAIAEAINPLTAKYDELQAIVDGLSKATEETKEAAKSYDEKIREIRKDFALAKENDATEVKKSTKKTSLLS